MTKQSQLWPCDNAAAHAMMLVSGFPKAINFDDAQLLLVGRRHLPAISVLLRSFSLEKSAFVAKTIPVKQKLQQPDRTQSFE
jgi:hypothetical protein